ncbi:transcriptional regulator with XRE-family HTH domain [Paraburkholderia sp. EB58]|uniref:helix-turn-helix domain-containing protein n=1 Tax=Paraburkholderia sp. EB58 TaxID=3035125 RepID=UPI003D1F23A0
MLLLGTTLYQFRLVLRNTKQQGKISAMNSFGDTIRDLRIAQDLGLRETATKVGISPAYLSRIERGKERPPRPEVIKALAKTLAADPDVLFRLSSSTDPEVIDFLHDQPEAIALLRYLKDTSFTSDEVEQLLKLAEKIKKPAK